MRRYAEGLREHIVAVAREGAGGPRLSRAADEAAGHGLAGRVRLAGTGPGGRAGPGTDPGSRVGPPGCDGRAPFTGPAPRSGVGRALPALLGAGLEAAASRRTSAWVARSFSTPLGPLGLQRLDPLGRKGLHDAAPRQTRDGDAQLGGHHGARVRASLRGASAATRAGRPGARRARRAWTRPSWNSAGWRGGTHRLLAPRWRLHRLGGLGATSCPPDYRPHRAPDHVGNLAGVTGSEEETSPRSASPTFRGDPREVGAGSGPSDSARHPAHPPPGARGEAPACCARRAAKRASCGSPVDRGCPVAIPLLGDDGRGVPKDHLVTAAEEVTWRTSPTRSSSIPFDDVLGWERPPGEPAFERPATPGRRRTGGAPTSASSSSRGPEPALPPRPGLPPRSSNAPRFRGQLMCWPRVPPRPRRVLISIIRAAVNGAGPSHARRRSSAGRGEADRTRQSPPRHDHVQRRQGKQRRGRRMPRRRRRGTICSGVLAPDRRGRAQRQRAPPRLRAPRPPWPGHHPPASRTTHSPPISHHNHSVRPGVRTGPRVAASPPLHRPHGPGEAVVRGERGRRCAVRISPANDPRSRRAR